MRTSLVLALTLITFASACVTPVVCIDDGGTTLISDAGTDAGSTTGNLGTTGTHFAGTSCWCDTTTPDQESIVLSGSNGGGITTLHHRTTTAQGCEISQVGFGGSNLLVVLHTDGTASHPSDSSFGLIGAPRRTWRCEDGAFRLDTVVPMRAAGRTVELSNELWIAPPNCQTFSCSGPLTCSMLNTAGSCWLSGGSRSGEFCFENANCASGHCDLADGGLTRCQ